MTTPEKMREYRSTERGRTSARVSSRASTMAATWVRRNHPDIWSAMLDEAWAHLGVERPPVGRPRVVEHEP